MALNVFPESQAPIGIVGGGVKVYLDAKFTQQATVFDMTGRALQGNALNIPSTGTLPQFQCSASALYVRNAAGETIVMRPDAQSGAPTVTGSKGANAALTSLMAALSSLGLVVDQTS